MLNNAAPEIQSFIDYLKFEKRYSIHTIISYENDLSTFFNYLQKQFGTNKLTDISHNFIRSWMAELKGTETYFQVNQSKNFIAKVFS